MIKRVVLFLFLESVSAYAFSQANIEMKSIQETIGLRNYRQALDQINQRLNQQPQIQLLLLKAELFTILNQKDSASIILESCRKYYRGRPQTSRNADYYHTYLKYAVKFNDFDQVDRIARMYMAEPLGVLQRKLLRYPQFATIIPELHNLATGYYIHLAYLDAIGHPAKFEAYENSRLFDEEAYDYEEWLGNIKYFYLTGKWNRRAYQAIAAASLKDSLPEIVAYDNLLTFNQGRVYLDEEEELTDQVLDAKLDSVETILKKAVLRGSQVLTDAYLKRILYYQKNNEGKVAEFFTKAADNKFLYHKDIFPSLSFEEQRSAYALDTLFFDYFFKETLPGSTADVKEYETLLYYSSTWKNYLLLSKKEELLERRKLKLKNKQAIIDVIRFSKQGQSKYALTVFTNKLRTTHILSADAVEKRAYRTLTNSIKYKSQIPPELLQQFFGKTVAQLSAIGIKEIFFVPDGIYHLINPGTLIDPTTGTYLAEAFDIKQRLHVYEVNSKTAKLNKDMTATLFGNPRFNQLKSLDATRGIEAIIGEEFAQLPGTEIEVRGISDLLTTEAVQVESFMDTLATETRVKASFSQTDLLHIATHGFFLSKGSSFERQRYSGIVLARDQQNDGIMFAEEIRQLSKTHTSLIVLSACESSLGEISVGEGIAGLKSALKGAGAEGLILSYWKVNDEATSYFMRILYGFIQKNRDYESALKLARKKVREKYPQPYYWGAFDYQR